ncbi:hypothetical protein WR25_06421 [Diploscapter pachys]|uniref:Membrane-associated protein gex-3 n=1 Tax=Diploscapter pachys TaxID=2018661 RepID=A0A2A2K907_9BILA|nr:hypothetical protein WR25_06421 [Diploscapter pachys]
MAFKMDASQLKIAEKLIILNDRAAGMLTRIYNIKKACADPKSKPAFLSDKQMEGAIKHIVRKFPVVDTRSNSSTFQYVQSMKQDIIKSLSLYYYTFADLLELKDHIMQLLTNMDACQCHLDISLNFDLTAGYLNLVVNLITLMILLSRVEDRKAVLGLFNAAYDLQNGQSEASFPRLGQMILDYEQPLKKLHEDLSPLNRLIFSALTSLAKVYMRRNVTADFWRKSNIFSMTVSPQQILYAAQTDTMTCEYLSLDVMDRWIMLCSTICHTTLLTNQVIHHLWQSSLQMGLCVRLFRDEIFSVHSETQQFLESFKGNNKRVQDVKDCYSIALQTCATVHADRRRYLRSALKELVLLMKDQPGLLGPKILFVWMALSYSRDEVVWLLRHINEWPSSNKKGHKQTDELGDRQLPELLHFMLELRELVFKHKGVIDRYYTQYVNSYDAIVTAELISKLRDVPEDDAILLRDFAANIGNINSDTNFSALRMDWARVQARTSMARYQFQLQQNEKFAVQMNTTVFHLKMIDHQEELLKETSDLSIYCFYNRLMELQWAGCLQLPAQCRYSLSFARICSHFPSALHNMCPEEKSYVIEKSLGMCNLVLEDVCRATGEFLAKLCASELALSEQTSPGTIAENFRKQLQINQKSKNQSIKEVFQPAGEESHRVDRFNLTYEDKLQTTLMELCAAISMNRQIVVADHIFAPREYLCQHLELKFVDLLHEMLFSGSNGINPPLPRRPSEMLMALQAYMTVLQNADTCELRCLAQIIGPYGVKYLSERLIWHVASQINELNKIVLAYKEPLQTARTKFDQADMMREVLNLLSQESKDKKSQPGSSSAADAILQRTIIIGQICSFRDALHSALRQVIAQRLPFLQASFNNLYESLDDAGKIAIGELSAAMGVCGPVDIALANAVQHQNSQTNPEEHYLLSCLLLVAISICLPRLAVNPLSAYKPSIKASLNNSHCIPVAVNTMAGALFHLHNRNDTQMRMKEFLALASSCILRMAQEADGREEMIQNQAMLYVILEKLVQGSSWLSLDILEDCFPYSLIRTAYQQAYEIDAQPQGESK